MKKRIKGFIFWILSGTILYDPLNLIKAEPDGIGLFMVATSILFFYVALLLIIDSYQNK